jgi:hypothetical protein
MVQMSYFNLDGIGILAIDSEKLTLVYRKC